jgi:hypothetical protein
MTNPSRMLDRGRLLLGVLLVAPVGALIAAPLNRPVAATPSVWTAQYGSPGHASNEAEPDQTALVAGAVNADEILSQLTPQGAAPTSASAAPTAGGLVSEVGEADATSALPKSYIPGAPPSADLAAVLRKSQQRFSATQAPPTASGTAAALARNPNVIFTRSSQVNDLLTGGMDPRVVDLLTWVTSRRQSITITSLRTDHSTCVAGSNPCRVSAHHLGRAVDIAAVNGQACTGGPTSECGRLFEEMVASLRGTQFQPSQIIYGYDPWPTESWNFAMSNHRDHIHVGY